MLDIREIVRRIQAGDGDRRIAREMQVSRKTVAKYRAWTAEVGWQDGPLPDPATVQARLGETLSVVAPPKVVSSVEGFRDAIMTWRREGVECRAIQLHADSYTRTRSSRVRSGGRPRIGAGAKRPESPGQAAGANCRDGRELEPSNGRAPTGDHDRRHR